MTGLSEETKLLLELTDRRGQPRAVRPVARRT